MATEAH